MSKYVFCAIQLIIILLSAAPAHTQTSSRAEAMCSSMSCESGLYSVGHNPAGTAYSPLGAMAGYTSRFGLRELSQKFITAAVPLGRGAVSAEFQHHGFQLYNTSSAVLAYALPLGQNLSAGAGIRYHHLHIDDTPHKYQTASGEIGILYRATGHLSMGSWVSNITNSQYQEADSALPVRIQAGIRYSMYGGHSLSLDLEKNSQLTSITVRCAAYFRLNSHISVMAGISSHPVTIGAGVEVSAAGFRMIFAASHHEYLGWNPSASVAWQKEEAANGQ